MKVVLSAIYEECVTLRMKECTWKNDTVAGDAAQNARVTIAKRLPARGGKRECEWEQSGIRLANLFHTDFFDK